MHNADDSTVQVRNNNPTVATAATADIPNGDSERELVERVASSEEDEGGEAPD